jgi:hypothetical protein
MSAPAFVLAFFAGAAILALWGALRYASRAPTSLWRVLAHLLVANFATSAAPVLMLRSPILGGVAGMMLIVLPALVYFFLACAWLLMLVQRMLAPYR